MSNREKLISRIQKLLALASSNSSTAEAETALLQARKLMAEHAIDEGDIEDKQDEVAEQEALKSGRLNDLKLSVLSAIAHNHRCNLIWHRSYDAASDKVLTTMKLVGYERDRSLVMALNDWAWRVVSSQADVFVKNLRKTKNLDRSDLLVVRRSYVLGFASGLQEAYTDQIVANPQWALVLGTPKEVEDHIEKATKGRKMTSNVEKLNGASFQSGTDAGKDHVASTSHKDTPRLAEMPKMLGA